MDKLQNVLINFQNPSQLEKQVKTSNQKLPQFDKETNYDKIQCLKKNQLLRQLKIKEQIEKNEQIDKNIFEQEIQKFKTTDFQNRKLLYSQLTQQGKNLQKRLKMRRENSAMRLKAKKNPSESEEMNYFDLEFPTENYWDVIESVGTLQTVHFMDCNLNTPQGQRPFANRMLQCGELEERINVIEKVCNEFNKTIIYSQRSDPILSIMSHNLTERQEKEQKAPRTLFNEIENSINEKYQNILQISENYQKLKLKKQRECEYFNLLRKLQPNLPSDIGHYTSAHTSLSQEDHSYTEFFYFCGVVQADVTERLQKLVYRISRGNVFFQMLDLDFDNDNQELNFNEGPPKKIFFIFFQIGKSQTLKVLLKKALESVQATFYTIPNSSKEINVQLQELEKSCHNNSKVLEETAKQIDNDLRHFYNVSSFTNISLIEEYRIIIEKERAIISTANRMVYSKEILKAQVFVPKKHVQEFKNHVRSMDMNIRCSQDDFERKRYKPPTYFELNDFTAPFQQIVDTYGVPRYGEVNPGLFTTVTFPYEFGVMYGDIGHGGAIMLLGYFLINKFQILKNQLQLQELLKIRYLLFFMGLFACYCGLVYNDFLSIPWNLFGSCYTRTNDNKFVRDYPGCTYLFGFDPITYQSSTEVSFINSFKMKLSVIVGVIHMNFGIIMKAVNSIHFGLYLDFLFEFIPQIVFMCCTFGYMCLAIVIKWLQDWGDGSKAPSIISIFINMGVADENSVLYGDSKGLYQTHLQQTLFMIAGICVLLMLIPKPLILAIKHSFGGHHKPHPIEEQKLQEELIGEEEHTKMQQQIVDPNVEPEEEHEISEIFVHQMIEVIEFVLGSISNTASYLRLWALSLAHGQLAKVFFEMTILNQIKAGNAIVAMLGFPMFIVCTVAVILIMDFMECFLHTLRLHWVEFQNKFYKGDGYPFLPLSFSKKIDEELIRKYQLRFKGEQMQFLTIII